jgi:hypothetical protein
MRRAGDVMPSPLHVVVEMALRRQRPGTGSARAFLRERTSVLQWPRLAFLEPLFAVIGAVGLRLYAPERTTTDLDVIIFEQDAPDVERRLAGQGWARVGDLTIGGSSWRSEAGHYLDVVVRREAWWPGLIAAAQVNRDRQGLPILPLAGQVWLKLRAGRTVDAGDLSRLLGLASDEQIAEVRAFVQANAAPDEVQDFESLVQLGRLEFGSEH